ncbi:RNA 2',3'-cyclic phosphodiesterase [Ornithinimicrobium sp. LYQ103]|uniref:RNA 2',3'-cyclic phosphodiesterase n=1 Tax=Ornithinimicrobium sp. LYQ103 TaxID=3378796 RepID=UPI0038526301
MRAFLAVVPPPQVVDALLDHVGPRRDALAAEGLWRWTRPEHLHLTLAFLPDLAEWREEELLEAGAGYAARQDPLELRLVGAGAYPDPGGARVLWAGVEESVPGTLGSWSKGLRAVASHAGAGVDGTRFSPHVTVARASGRPHPAGHLLQALDTLRTPPWRAEEVVLIGSHLGQGPGGTPRYETRHTWEIGSS